MSPSMHRFCASLLLILALASLQPAQAGHWEVSLQSTGQDTVTVDGQTTSYPWPDVTSYAGGPAICDFEDYHDSQCDASTINATITPTLTWTPDSATDASTPPTAVLVQIYVETGAEAGNLADLQVNDGFNDPLAGDDVELPDDGFYYWQGGFNDSPVCASYGTHWVVKLNPSAANVIGIDPITMSASGGGEQWDASTGVGLYVQAFPITIAAPDPLGRPDLGDGKNQYVYGAQQPDGFLYVPGAIQAVGASHDAMEWLIGGNPIVGSGDQVDLKIENPTIAGAFTHQWLVSNDTIYVNTPQDQDSPYPQYEYNNWIFKGLPSNNSGFGNHDVNLYVQGTNTQTAKIQTFFSGTASNWPNSDGVTPNWYYYYNQVYPAPGDYANIPQAGLTEVVFTPGSTNPQTWGITQFIGNGVSSVPRPKPVFVLGTATGNNPRRIQNPRIGDLQIGGIYSFIEACRHEVAHRALLLNGEHIPYRDEDGPPYGITDSDGDHIPDNIEAKYHLDPENADTTGYYGDTEDPNNLGKGDVECLADIQGLGAVIQNEGLWTEDWCDFGLQLGKRPPFGNTQYLGAFFP